MPLRRITALQDARVHFINDAPMMCILRDSLAVSRPSPPFLCPAARTLPDGDAARLCRQREPNAPNCRQGAALRRRRLAECALCARIPRVVRTAEKGGDMAGWWCA